MLRVIIVLIGGLLGYSAIGSGPDAVNGAYALVEHIRNHHLFTAIVTFVGNWHFAVGLLAGIAAGEGARMFWRFARVASAFLTMLSGRLMHYAAAAAVVGIVIYFI